MEKSKETPENLPTKPAEDLNETYDKAETKFLGIKNEPHVANNENLATDIFDAEITSKIKAEIMNDPLLNKFHINVFTHNRKVELCGAVDYQICVDRSNEIAHGVEGVKTVVNEVFARKDEKIEEPLKPPEVEKEIKPGM